MDKRTRKAGTTAPNRPAEQAPGQDDALFAAICRALPVPPRTDEEARVWLDLLVATSSPLPP
ncbi:MAG TPA: hypothetical protein VF576_11825, partial [Rubricoccaceae bacterium]